jgi:DNA-binding transcriptional ArsR family regulator
LSTYIVKRLEQAKLLTDPFKLKLIERFAGSPSTTKQVADRMGEKAPRLYRHVDALVEEGLLELIEEKPKRGTIERYYQTVADRFEIHPDLFIASADSTEDGADMIRSLLRDTESDLVQIFDRYKAAGSLPEDKELPIVMRVGVRATPEEIQSLRDKLEDWHKECSEMHGNREDSDDLVSWSGLLAFYPEQDK